MGCRCGTEKLHGRIGLQGAGKSATGSSNFFLRAEGSLSYTEKLDTLTLAGVWYFATADETTSDNKAAASGKWNRDFKEASRWFYFARAEWERDAIQLWWDQRAGIYLGAGHQFVEEDDWKLTVKLAPGAQRVFGNVEEWFAILFARVESKWQLDRVWLLEANGEYLPAIETWNEDYTLYGEVKLVGKMSFVDGLALEVGVSEEYDTFQPDVLTSDFRYHAGVRLDF